MINVIEINGINDVQKYGDLVCAHGFFDGVHLAHQKLITLCVEYASENDMTPSVITFTSKVAEKTKNENSLLMNMRLTSLNKKIKILEVLGIEYVFVINIEKFSKMEGKEYFERVVKPLGVKHFIMGKDNRLGHKASFSSCDVKEYVKELSFEIVDLININNEKMGSTNIKAALKNNSIEEVNDMINRYYSIEGIVVEGNKLGRTIGFPTINLYVEQKYVIPRLAVYASLVEIDGVIYKGMTNIGYNPSVSNVQGNIKVETFIFDFDKEVYDKEISIYFVKTLREEKKFASLELLKDQLKIDKENAQDSLKEIDDKFII